MNKLDKASLGALCICAVLNGCGVTPVKFDELSCPRPVKFARQQLEKQDVIIAETYFEKFVRGNLDPIKDDQAFRVYSQILKDQGVQDYFACRAVRSGYIVTQAQAKYINSKIDFMKTTPTPGQYVEWELKNPFPGPQSRLIVTNQVLKFLPSQDAAETFLLNDSDNPIRFQVSELPQGFYLPYKAGLVEPGQKFRLTVVRTSDSVALVADPNPRFTITTEGYGLLS